MTACGRPHLAIVDDEPSLRRSVGLYLEAHGFAVTCLGGGAELRALLEQRPVDLVLLDLRMPGEDGLSVLRWLRARGELPVITVTALGDPVDRVVGLESGADDYVVKPFEMRELLARVRCVLRRARDRSPATRPAEPPAEATAASGPQSTAFGACRFDLAQRRLHGPDGREVPLSAVEHELLAAFALRPNEVLTRDQLAALVDCDGTAPAERSIDVRVTRLRRKIEPDMRSPCWIRTVRGQGYVFMPGG